MKKLLFLVVVFCVVNAQAGLIPLTIIYPPPGTKVWIDTDEIVYFGKNITHEGTTGSVIFTTHGGRINVKETPEQIKKLMDEASKTGAVAK